MSDKFKNVMRIVITHNDFEFHCTNVNCEFYIWSKCTICNCRILHSNWKSVNIQQHKKMCKGKLYTRLVNKPITLVA